MGDHENLPDQIDLRDFRIEEVDGQIPFDFARPARLLDLTVNATREFIRLISNGLNKAGTDFRRTLEKNGVRVFDVVAENDFASVETDYGAPAKGLSFFAKPIHPTRSFRYAPTRTVEGVYKTHTEQATSIAKSLIRKGYKVFDGLKEEQYPSQIHFANGGVTRAFGDVAGDLIRDFSNVNAAKKSFSHDQGAAILVPVPTYGLFLYKLRQLVEGHDVEIVPVRRHDNGAVDQSSLATMMCRCDEENRRIIGFYDCNPQNPTGYIREKSETEDLAEILMIKNRAYIDKDLDCFEDILEEKPEISSKNDMLRTWVMSLERPQGGMVIIDDMAYEGLEYTVQKKPYSFGQVSPEVAQRTAVLKGISKIGLPGLRTGLLVAHSEIVSPLAQTQLIDEFSASSLGVDILTARFGEKSPYRKSFSAHVRRLRKEHDRQAGVAEALFRGIDHASRLTDEEKEKLVRNYAGYAGIDPPKAKEILTEGLNPFFLEGQVDAGFFQRINCEALANRGVYAQFSDSDWPRPLDISHSSNLYWLFRSFGMKVVSAGQQGMPEGALQVRITTSLPEKEMFRFYNSMRQMREYFFGPNPEYQPDLFRENVPAFKP